MFRLAPSGLACVALVVGIALSGGVALHQDQANHELAKAAFEPQAQRVSESVAERMRLYENGVRGARAAALSGGGRAVGRMAFRQAQMSRNVDVEYPGARGFGLIWRVRQAEEARFVEGARSDGWPEFKVRQLAPHDGERFVIQYIEPVERNAPAVGLDIASEANRRQAALASIGSGAPTLTGPITLVQATGKPQRSFLLLLPIYWPGAPTDTPAQRNEATIGWAYAPLLIDEVLNGVDVAQRGVTLALSDVTDGQGAAFFQSVNHDSATASGLATIIDRALAGRTWRLDIRATPEFVNGLNLVSPRTVFAVGCAFASLLAALAYLLAAGVRRAQHLRAEQARHSSIVASSEDAIVAVSLDGRVTDWNASAVRLFGYEAASAIGRDVRDLIVPEGLEGEEAMIRTTVLRGEHVPSYDTTRRHCAGHLIEVSVTASPIYTATGRCAGFSKTIRDISEARRAQRALATLNSELEAQVAERTALLASSRQVLQGILDAMPSQIGLWDRSLVNQVANRAYEAWFGVAPDQVRGRHMSTLLGPDLFERSLPRLQAALAGEPQSFFEHEVPLPDGPGKRHAHVNYLPHIVDGAVQGVYTVVHDVSELVAGRLQLAAALRENEALLQTLHQHAIVSVADRKGRILEVNDNFCRISGYSRETLVGQNHRLVNSGTHPREFWFDMWRTIASGRSWRGEVCNRAADGSLYWVDSIIAPFVGSDGTIEKYISIRHDITARKRAEESLRSTNRRFELAADSAGVGVWDYDIAGGALVWDERMFALYGRQACDDVLPYSIWSESLHPEDRARCDAAFAAAVEGTLEFDIEFRIVRPDGALRHLKASAHVMRDAGGKATRVTGVNIDVSARHALEAALRKQNELLSTVVEYLPCGVSVFDADLHLVSSNSEYRRLLDFPDALFEDAAPRFEDFIRFNAERGEYGKVDVEQHVAEIVERARKQPQAHQFERLRPNGVPLEIRGTPMPGGGFVTTYTDITERQRSEQLLEQRERMMRLVIDSFPDPLAHWDADLRCTVANRAYMKWMGLDPEQMIGRSQRELFGEAVFAQNEAAMRAALRGEVSHLERSRLCADGVQRDYLLQYVPDIDGDTVRGFISVVVDVTPMKRVETELRAAVHQAQKASLAKTQFLANMSHEIRTPVNAVIGLSYLLERTDLDAEQKGFLRKIGVAGKSLLGVINNVLDLSKIEAEELSVERSPFRLNSVLQEVRDLLAAQAEEKDVEFVVCAETPLPVALEGDAMRLHQMLTNLANNAIKFTERGSVTLRVARVGGDDAIARLRFSVQDTGIGIAPEVLARLFKPFAQADVSTTRRFGGTGLGLSIVSRLATLMGGTVGAQSTPGVGSTFWIELPLAVSEVQAAETVPGSIDNAPAALTGLHLLVTDDSDINLEVAQRILELEGATVTVAHNGQEAIDLLVEQPDGYDLVLMDVQMPVLDGHDATRRIRSGLGLTKLPIIALTAGALVTEQRSAAAAGMDDFLTKPFDPDRLVKCIRRHVARRARQASTGRQGPSVPAAAPAPDADWPEIEGIDTKDVQARLRGDMALFQKMLRRLLADFSDLQPLLDAGCPLDPLAAKLHSLKGSAATLGAREIARLAGDAETDCRAGKAEQIPPLLGALGNRLRQLRDSATGPLEAIDRAVGMRDLVSATPLDPRDLADLIQLLISSDFAALERFKALAPSLRRMDSKAFSHLQDQVENLRFGDAATLLKTLARQQVQVEAPQI